MCFKCPTEHGPNTCNTITMCQHDEVCSELPCKTIFPCDATFNKRQRYIIIPILSQWTKCAHLYLTFIMVFVPSSRECEQNMVVKAVYIGCSHYAVTSNFLNLVIEQT